MEGNGGKCGGKQGSTCTVARCIFMKHVRTCITCKLLAVGPG